ncbi:MAG: ABC transporter permease [Candidatus Rokuibacteriota bacterium]|jgi:ABC-type dipeptide/oligopeptide/nickel transport system permease subunit|nr:MAG: ABC transporter permease [Candidatus Rokubacteria bacterium]
MAVARFFRSSPLGGVCALLLLLLASVAVLADRLAPYNPLTANYGVIRDPPLARHVLGTDHLGRDVLSRIIFGARVTLLVAISSVLLGDTIGFIWGVASGYLGGRADLISQRVLDVLMSLPSLILALLLMAGLGAGLTTVIVAIAVTRVPLSSRVVRSMVLSVKELAYVEAARVLGASEARVMARHVAPQCLAPFLIITTGHLGAAIFIEAALSFVGVGVPPPTPSWGNMLGGVLAEAFKPPWWMVVFPGVAITVTILAVNLFGDALRDFLDPKLK